MIRKSPVRRWTLVALSLLAGVVVLSAAALGVQTFGGKLIALWPGAHLRSPEANALLSVARSQHGSAMRLRGTERLTGLSNAAQKYREAEQFDPTVADLPAREIALEDYADELMAALKASRGNPQAQFGLQSQARALNTQLGATRRSADWALQLAAFEFSAGKPDEARLPLSIAYGRAKTLPQDDRDAIILAAVRQRLAMTPSDRQIALLWAQGARDPKTRAQALAAAARARLAKGDYAEPALAALVGLDPGAIAQRPDLADLSQTFRLKTNLEVAAVLALAIKEDAPRRDDALQAAAMQAAGPDRRDGAGLAALGIADAARRDAALADLASAYLKDPQVSAATDLIAEISDPKLKALGLAEAAQAVAMLSLDTQAAALATAADAEFRKASMSTEAADRYHRYLTRAAVATSDYKTARAQLKKIRSADARAQVQLISADLVLRSRQYAETPKFLSGLPASAQAQANGFRAMALAGEGKVPAAARLALRIKDVAPRQLALAACVRAAAQSNPTLAARLMSEIEKAPLPANPEGRADALAAKAMALASLGRVQEAAAILPSSYSERNSRDDAVLDLAEAWVRQGDLSAAERVSDMATGARLIGQVAPRIARTLGDIGLYRTATEYTLKIADPMERVQAQRAIATQSARSLDEEKLLTRAKRNAKVNAASRIPPFLRTSGFDYYQMPEERPTGEMGGLPAFAGLRVAQIAREIPPTSDGIIEIIPMVYNGYGQKFLYNTVANLYSNIDSDLYFQQSQATRYPLYIHIGSGVVTIPSLYKRLQESGHADVIVKTGSVYLLRLPIMVAPGATLVVTGSDVSELRLEQERGVMIVNAGELYFHGAKLVGWETAKNAPSDLTYETRRKFRPFIVSWGGSHMSAAASVFSHMGFAGVAKAYGFSYSQGPLQILRDRPGSLAPPTGDLVENVFDNLYFGFFTFGSGRVRVVGNEYKDNIIYGVDPHDFSKDLEVAFNTSYGAHKKHGFIASRSVTNSFFVGNMSFENHGSGVMMDRASSGNLIYANRVWNNHGDGVAIFESPCNVIASNSLQGNGRDAVKVRNSTDVGIFSNTIQGNHGAAFRLYTGAPEAVAGSPGRNLKMDPYSQFASAAIIGNTVGGGGAPAFVSVGFGAVAVKNNRVAAKSATQVYAGDLGAISSSLWRLQEEGVVVRSSCAPSKKQLRCPLFRSSLIAGGGDSLPAAQGKGAVCAGVVDFDEETAEAADGEENDGEAQ